MDAYEATKTVFSRIQGFDPENASKIMGLLLIHDYCENEMIRLAFGPETLLQSVVLKARKNLGLPDFDNPDDVISPHSYRAQPNNGSPCLYYSRGYCKNGNACRFLHTGFTESLECLSKMDMVEQYPDLLRAKYTQQRAAASGLIMSSSSRQIYLTFPADSTFREEDVSKYFSVYGPVQDVRIPYQQRRMFGFVTFVYSESVRIILAKGNPHFVCQARVLVKPYKEKGKAYDKFRKQQQQFERFGLSPCGSPTGLDSGDPYYLQNMLWRKMDEQADFQKQVIELQSRRLMNLELPDKKPCCISPFSPTKSHHVDEFISGVENLCLAAENCSGDELQKNCCSDHNLPESPFASDYVSPFSEADSIASSLFLASSKLGMASLKSCYTPRPRFSPSRETVGV